MPKPRIGLLGGSFNPAHAGHRHVSLEALKRLGLDEVWWLVAPQNPLKPVAGMAPFEERLAEAKRFARHPRIFVLGIEEELGKRYTIDTIAALQRFFPRQRFVWLMGADNLAQIRYWKDWRQIFARLPIAIFARPAYCRRALAEKPAQLFARARVLPPARKLASLTPPAWAFMTVKLDPTSATAIRSGRSIQRKR